METAMVSNMGSWLIHRGSIPPTVVAVVSMMGLSRCWQASPRWELPLSTTQKTLAAER